MTGPGVIELRQYTLLPGRRDTLIDLFDTYFVDGQRDCGIDVIGQYRDDADPDRFVWMRGFSAVDTRAEALGRFYYGPIWQQHRERANATMIDSDDVLLLTPRQLSPGFLDGGGGADRSGGADADPTRPIRITVWSLTQVDPDAEVGPDAEAALAELAAAALAGSGAEVLAVLTSCVVDNDFPALPLRGDRVLVAVTRGGPAAAPDPDPTGLPLLQRMRLSPTSGSRLR